MWFRGSLRVIMASVNTRSTLSWPMMMLFVFSHSSKCVKTKRGRKSPRLFPNEDITTSFKDRDKFHSKQPKILFLKLKHSNIVHWFGGGGKQNRFLIWISRNLFHCSSASHDGKVATEEIGHRSKTAAGVLASAAGEARERVQAGQISQRQQAPRAVEVSQPHRGADQNLVPEPSDEVEEAADVEVEDRSASGTLLDAPRQLIPSKHPPQLLHASDAPTPAIPREESLRQWRDN